MVIPILWILLGVYFMFLGLQILVLKNYKKLESLKRVKFVDKEGFIKRYGLIEVIFGFLIACLGVVDLVLSTPVLFSFMVQENQIDITLNYLIVLVAVIGIISIVLNEKYSKKEN